MPLQTYKLYTGNAYKGQMAYSSEHHVVVKGTLEDATLDFGVSLKRGVGAVGVAAGHETGNVYGVSLREINHEAATRPSDGTTFYNLKDSVSVMREGTINVLVTARAAVRGVKVNVVDVTGEFTGGAAGAGETQAVNMTFLEAGLVGDVVKARIDIVA